MRWWFNRFHYSLITGSQCWIPPSNSIWPHLSYGVVRSKREYCHNCSLVVVLCSFCSCTVIWAADRFCLPDLASSHWVHSLCLDYFVCVRLFSCVISACMLYYCNTVRRAWLDWGLSGWLTTLLQCSDTVGWVIRPVKTVGRITYIVLVQMLNHAQSVSHSIELMTSQGFSLISSQLHINLRAGRSTEYNARTHTRLLCGPADACSMVVTTRSCSSDLSVPWTCRLWATEPSRLLRRKLGIGCLQNCDWQRHSDKLKTHLFCRTYVDENTAKLCNVPLV